jgi:cell division transport system permease protein
VRPRVGETGLAAAGRAAETLSSVPGVSEAAVMDRKAAEDLLRPWLGEAVLPDLPLPFLVTVRLNPRAPASTVVLSRALAEAGLDASVDDHSLWRGEVERSAALITALSLAGFLLIACAAGAAIVYATRAGLAAQRAVIETLSLSGATEGYIAGLFQTRFGLLAAGAGAVGAVTAAVLVAALRALGGAGGLTAALPLAWSDILLLSPCPLLAGTVALVAARIAAQTTLARAAPDPGTLGGRRSRR